MELHNGRGEVSVILIEPTSLKAPLFNLELKAKSSLRKKITTKTHMHTNVHTHSTLHRQPATFHFRSVFKTYFEQFLS